MLSSASTTRGLGAGQDFAREIAAEFQHAVDLPLPQIAQRRRGIGVGHRVEGLRVGGDGLEHFLELHGGHAVVLIHHADVEMLDFAAKGIAQHDQLHQRHDHGNDDQRRAAAEPAQVAFNDGKDAVHGGQFLCMMNALSAAAGACRASRN